MARCYHCISKNIEVFSVNTTCGRVFVYVWSASGTGILLAAWKIRDVDGCSGDPCQLIVSGRTSDSRLPW